MYTTIDSIVSYLAADLNIFILIVEATNLTLYILH